MTAHIQIIGKHRERRTICGARRSAWDVASRVVEDYERKGQEFCPICLKKYRQMQRSGALAP